MSGATKGQGMSGQQKKLRLVFDTNVLVNAMVAELAPEQARPQDHVDKLLTDWALASHHLCFTRPTFMEFARVGFDINNRTNMPPTSAFARKQYVDRLQSLCTKVEPGRVDIRSPDPDDQMILKAAAGAGAQYLVSRDYDGVLSLRRYGNCLFLNPNKFGRQVMGAPFEEFLATLQARPSAPAVRPK